LLDPFVAPLGISSLPTKQTRKKQGKGTVNSGDGLVSVAYDSGGDSSIVKTLAAVQECRAQDTTCHSIKVFCSIGAFRKFVNESSCIQGKTSPQTDRGSTTSWRHRPMLFEHRIEKVQIPAQSGQE
jgi:hypothetical protein